MMNGYPGYQQSAFPAPQGVTPWAPPQQPAAPPAPVLPPSAEGTALAAILGGTAAALATAGTMYLINVQPESPKAHLALMGAATLFGGGTAAFGHRVVGNRAYQAATHAVNTAGVNPHKAASALRLNGRLGRWGDMELSVPTQTLKDAAQIWQSIANPATPSVMNDYCRLVRENTESVVGKAFVTHMPPPEQCANPNAAPPWMYPQQPQTPQPQWQYAPQGYPPQGYQFVVPPQPQQPPNGGNSAS